LQSNHIRILILYPGAENEDIVVNIRSVSLSEGDNAIQALKALSHTGGDPNPAKIIFCQEQTISVTPNLYDALLAIRRPDEYRILWIDQICVNQLDNEEKNSQVRKCISSTLQPAMSWHDYLRKSS
jgi:hypothetical protein